MVLAMPRPWKHPKTGIYWLRKRVPDDLRPVVGKLEEKRSLRTREPDQAKRLHAEALADLEKRWANLRAGPRDLTEREAHEIASGVYDQWLDHHRDNPSEQRFWRLGGALRRSGMHDWHRSVPFSKGGLTVGRDDVDDGV